LKSAEITPGIIAGCRNLVNRQEENAGHFFLALTLICLIMYFLSFRSIRPDHTENRKRIKTDGNDAVYSF